MPGLIVMLDPHALPVKDIGTGFYTLCLPAGKNIRQLSDDDQHPSVFIFGNLRAEPDHVAVNIAPF